MTLHELQRRLKPFDIRQEAANSIYNTREILIAYNRKQLLRGLDSDGNYLSPKYSEDPYFKTKEAAARYAQWKKKISPDTDRPFDVPNLFINGRFHDSVLVASVSKDSYGITSHDPNASNIQSKFGEDNIYGLNPESAVEYYNNSLLPSIREKIRTKIGI